MALVRNFGHAVCLNLRLFSAHEITRALPRQFLALTFDAGALVGRGFWVLYLVYKV